MTGMHGRVPTHVGERPGGYFWCFVRDALITEHGQKEVAISEAEGTMRLQFAGADKGRVSPADAKAQCTT